LRRCSPATELVVDIPGTVPRRLPGFRADTTLQTSRDLTRDSRPTRQRSFGMSLPGAPAQRDFLGLSPALLWGYVAIALFMTGDGLEQAFLSDYLVTSPGYTQEQSGTLFTVYGLVVAIAAFASGVLAEYFGPRRIMAISPVAWIIFHAGFMIFGIMANNYPMMLVMYAIRAAAYPMFVYSFVVWISYAAPQNRLSSAMGWFWASYSIGVGVFGSYLPSLTIPWIGEVTTLWISIGFIALGGVLAAVLVSGRGPEQEGPRTLAGLGRTLGQTIALPFRNPQIALGMVQRVINQIALYAFIVMMPIVFVRDIGFEQTEWLQLWGLVYLVTVFTNLMWGVLGTTGMVIAIAGIYLFGSVLTYFMKVDQGALARHEAEQAAIAEAR